MKKVLQIVLLALAPGIADAKVAAFYLTDMILEVDNIVIGTVDSVTAGGKEWTNAVVEVNEVLKGPRIKTIEVDVTKTWACDVSNARKGEALLMFVLPDKETKRNRAYAFGRGLMPITAYKGDRYVNFWPEVWMKEIRMIEGGPAENDQLKANLTDMKAYIKRTIKNSHGVRPKRRGAHRETMSLKQALTVDAVGTYGLENTWHGRWRITSQTGCYTNWVIGLSEMTANLNRVVCSINGEREVYFSGPPAKRGRASSFRKVLPTDDEILACTNRSDFARVVDVPVARVPGFRAIQLFAQEGESTVSLVSIWYREPNENFPLGGCFIKRAQATTAGTTKRVP